MVLDRYMDLEQIQPLTMITVASTPDTGTCTTGDMYEYPPYPDPLNSFPHTYQGVNPLHQSEKLQNTNMGGMCSCFQGMCTGGTCVDRPVCGCLGSCIDGLGSCIGGTIQELGICMCAVLTG